MIPDRLLDTDHIHQIKGRIPDLLSIVELVIGDAGLCVIHVGFCLVGVLAGELLGELGFCFAAEGLAAGV